MYTICMLETVHTLHDTPSIVIMKDFRTDHWSEVAIRKRATMTRFKVHEVPSFYVIFVFYSKNSDS